MPITAMARVRTSGRVRSASSAETAADTAPAPCTERATVSAATELRQRADQRARREQHEADRDDRLAAETVGPAAERDLQQRLGEAVGAHGEAEQLRRVVRQLARVQRQHGQHQEQPEHARSVDRRERTDRAALLRRERRPGGGVFGSDWLCLESWAYISRLTASRPRPPSAMDVIRIRGARTHNLQGIDLDLPRNRLIVITGLSGSGKSSLAFDTIYAEGQRRYVESLSAYARQFLSVMEKPDVDHIEGLSPAIAIEQKATSHNPRSTVGTVTEIYDYLRVLYARAGVPRCPEHGEELAAQTVSQMVDQVLALPEGTAVLLLAPVVQDRKGEHAEAFEHLKAQGFVRAFVDGKLVELDAPPRLEPRRRHSVDAVVDRLRVRPDAAQRLAESFETALALSQGVARVVFQDEPERTPLVFSNRYACTSCGYSLARLEPRLFSFNNPTGACGTCGGLGVQEYFDPARVVVNPGAVARGRRGARLGPPQRALLPADPGAGAALPLRHRDTLGRPAGGGPARAAVGQRRGERRVPLLRRARRQHAAQPSVGGHPAQPRAALPRDRVVHGARGTRQVPRHAQLRRLRRQPPQPRGAPRVRRRAHAAAARRAADRADLAVLRRPARRGLARRDRGPARARDRRPPDLPRGRGPRLPVARPQRRDALGRRGAAHPARKPDRLGAGRRDVHPRRALDRPAPARQPAPARHAHPAARPRQHRARGRARRGRDPPGRPRRGPRPRGRRPRRAHRRAGHAGRDRGGARLADGPVPERPTQHPGAAGAHAGAERPGTAGRGGDRQQPARRHR